MEELVDQNKLVCLNDGRGTRVNVNTGSESVLYITLVLTDLAGVTDWKV